MYAKRFVEEVDLLLSDKARGQAVVYVKKFVDGGSLETARFDLVGGVYVDEDGDVIVEVKR